jgi:hypothetical protein
VHPGVLSAKQFSGSQEALEMTIVMDLTSQSADASDAKQPAHAGKKAQLTADSLVHTIARVLAAGADPGLCRLVWVADRVAQPDRATATRFPLTARPRVGAGRITAIRRGQFT